MRMLEEQSNKQACNHRRVEITWKDLPLSCPPRDDRIWDAHPRVYLPIEETATGNMLCPYCGTEYTLQDFTPTFPPEKSER